MLARATLEPPPASDPEALEEALRGLFVELMIFHRGLARDQGLTLQQLMLLKGIESEGPLQPSQIAERYGITRPAASVEISALERRGWVARSLVKGNRRSRLTSLTPKATRVLKQVHEARREFLERGFATLTSSQRHELDLALHVLQRHFQGWRDAARPASGRCP